METTILLKPELQWREKPRWYSGLGAGVDQARTANRVARSDYRERADSRSWDAALRLPGISNAWTMPIKGRLDMLVDRHSHAHSASRSAAQT